MEEYLVGWCRTKRYYTHFYETLKDAQKKAREMQKKGATFISIRHQRVYDDETTIKITILGRNIPF